MRRYLSSTGVDADAEIEALRKELGPQGLRALTEQAPEDYRYTHVGEVRIDPMTPAAMGALANFVKTLGATYFIAAGYNAQVIKRALSPAEIERGALEREWSRREQEKADATAA